jgi:hypothetical protein
MPLSIRAQKTTERSTEAPLLMMRFQMRHSPISEGKLAQDKMKLIYSSSWSFTTLRSRSPPWQANIDLIHWYVASVLRVATKYLKLQQLTVRLGFICPFSLSACDQRRRVSKEHKGLVMLHTFG